MAKAAEGLQAAGGWGMKVGEGAAILFREENENV